MHPTPTAGMRRPMLFIRNTTARQLANKAAAAAAAALSVARLSTTLTMSTVSFRSVLHPLGIPTNAINQNSVTLLLIKVNFSVKEYEPKRRLSTTNDGLFSKRFPI